MLRNYKLNSITLKRIFDLGKIKSELEGKMEKIKTKSYANHLYEHLDRGKIKYQISEIEALIKINEDLYKANGGKIQ